MNGLRATAIVVMLAGVLSLAYGGFSYTRESTVAKLGSLELKAEQRERVNIPLWAGLLAIVAGGGMLVLGGRR